jgi:hypothetical protein
VLDGVLVGYVRIVRPVAGTAVVLTVIQEVIVHLLEERRALYF